jgi:hypothetical protein
MTPDDMIYAALKFTLVCAALSFVLIIIMVVIS